jgi:hypothetical protein
MAASQILLLWTALLALPALTVAHGDIANRGNFSISASTTLVQLTTTTISDALDTASTILSHDASETDNALDEISTGGGNEDDDYEGSPDIRTTTIDHSSASVSVSSTPISSSTTPHGPNSNFTLQPTQTPPGGSLSFPPLPTDIPWPPPAYSSSPTTSDECTPLAEWEPMTVWSVVYTATVTFNGSLADYTPPYPRLSVPTYCDDDGSSTNGMAQPSTSTNSHRMSVSTLPPDYEVPQPTEQPEVPAPETTVGAFPTVTHPKPGVVKPKPTKVGGGGAGGGGGGDKSQKEEDGTLLGPDGEQTSKRPTLTFITTDKNPSLTIPPTKPPKFTQAWHHGGGPGGGRGQHRSMLAFDLSAFTIVAGRSQVIINSHTFSDLKDDQSTTVMVDQGTFTIGPSAVVGHGQTIQKPAPEPTNAAVTQAPIQEVIVAGGQALTAIGQSVMVLHSTTYTYGPGKPEETVVVDDDTVRLGPSGIAVNGMTFGGPAMAAGVTKFEIVGGATITEIKPSLVIIEGETFTISPDMDRTTTVVNGQTLTIGPDGVTHSSLTIPMAEAAVTTTFKASITRDSDFPQNTGSSGSSKDKDNSKDKKAGDDDDDDDAGAFVRPDCALLILMIGMAIGVWELF